MKIHVTRGSSIVGGVSIPLLPIKSQRLYLVKKSDYNWQMEVIPMQERNPHLPSIGLPTYSEWIRKQMSFVV